MISSFLFSNMHTFMQPKSIAAFKLVRCRSESKKKESKIVAMNTKYRFFFWHHACSRLLSLHEQPTREIPGKHLNRFKLKIVRNVTRCWHNKFAGDRYNGWSARCECVAEHNRQSTIKRVSSWRSAKATLWIAYAQHYKRDRDKLDVLCVLCRSRRQVTAKLISIIPCREKIKVTWKCTSFWPVQVWLSTFTHNHNRNWVRVGDAAPRCEPTELVSICLVF